MANIIFTRIIISYLLLLLVIYSPKILQVRDNAAILTLIALLSVSGFGLQTAINGYLKG